MEKEALFVAFSTQKGGAGKTDPTVMLCEIIVESFRIVCYYLNLEI